MKDKRFLNLKETAEFLSLPLSYIYRISSEGALPGKIKWGKNTVRVDKEKLIDWLNSKQTEVF